MYKYEIFSLWSGEFAVRGHTLYLAPIFSKKLFQLKMSYL